MVENPDLSAKVRKNYPDRIQAAWTSIDEGWKQYEAIPRSEREDAVWKEFIALWATWKSDVDRYHGLALASLSESDPVRLKELYAQMHTLTEGPLAKSARTSVDKIRELNELQTQITNEQSAATIANAMRARTTSWMMGLGGVILALAFGITLSLSLARGLNGIVSSAGEGARQIADAADQVSSAAQEVADGSQEQAASIEESSASLEEMANMTRQNAENAMNAAKLAGQASAMLENSAGNAEEMNVAMLEIKVASDQTSKIIKTIDEIAFQTNLLALNAAVEAARAGEAGKGFAVVAEEVRNLAIRAATAARDTGELIEGNVQRVASGVERTERLKSSLMGTVTEAQKVVGLANLVAGASQEQSKGIEQINIAISQMSQIVQRNAGSSEQSAAAAQETAAQTESLREIVGRLMVIVNGSARA
jgi:methyl-accepting chemotaxis protein